MTTFAISIGVALVLLAAILFADRTGQKRFNDRWPPITDDEFLAACSPGTSRDTALRVRRIVSEQLGIPYDRIHPDQDFVRDLDCC
ncbi:hypothetical protein SH528x_005765 [Novipirellula sp. SH528]|uniref:hypothetical protein n=1 Tax=Novipirellula sp. SH528 TaxID=3454466 RepID=UPI003FA15B42